MAPNKANTESKSAAVKDANQQWLYIEVRHEEELSFQRRKLLSTLC